MADFIDQTASLHLTNFINTIGKLKTAVFDGDFGLGMRKISAVDVGNTRHE